ncbi:MAG: GxxExxY protein [Blastocatellia bacterium]|nr:GxxExxY protein [Blastocatellia bacterium]
MRDFLHGEITRETIGAAFEVWKVLGYGFLEKVYENSLVEELKRKGMTAEQQCEIKVFYKGVEVGLYRSDLFIEKKVLVELKADREYTPKHEAQLLDYLKATGVRVGLLLNFGEKKCGFKRLIV